MNFEKQDEGYIATDKDGKAIARITTCTPKAVEQGKPSPKPGETDKLPREAWTIHFCAGTFTVGTLTALVQSLPKE